MSTDGDVSIDISEFTDALKDIDLDERLYDKLLKHSVRADGTLKPEARVRIEWVSRFLKIYGFDQRQLDIEIPAGRVGRAAEGGSDTVFADIVVYRDFAKKEPFIVMETKAPGQKRGLLQAESYSRNLGAEFHGLHDGVDGPLFYRTARFSKDSEAIGNFPVWIGSKPIVEEVPKTMELPPFRDEKQMRDVVHRCHELILEKQGHDPAKAFDELTKLLFLKLYDEREVPSVYKVMVLASDTPKTVANRLRPLFEEATSSSRYKDVFESKFTANINVSLELDDFTILEVVKLLQGYSLINTVGSIDGADIKGTVFEEMVGNTFRGELAQFFTPRELVDCVVQMIPPKATDRVFDPSCGSGGFLVMAIRSVYNRLRVEHPNLNEQQLQNRITYFTEHFLFGSDINDRMARVAKMNMIMHGDGHTGIVNENGLSIVRQVPDAWRSQFRDSAEFDIIYSNPPFAGREKDAAILETFNLGKNKEGKAKSVSKEVLFIEMIIDLLAPGGKVGLVLPSGVFNNPSMSSLRDYIRKHTKILALVGLPHLAFQISGANNEGHLIFLEKVETVPDDYTIFIDWANQVGIDTIGRKIEKNDLNDVVTRFQKPPARNKIRLSELKDRFDPWYYHPMYTELIRRMKLSGHPWRKLGDIFRKSDVLLRRDIHSDSEVLRYIEKGHVDLEKGLILGYDEHILKTLPSRATYVLRANDVLFPDIYDSMRGVAIVPEEYAGFIATSRFFVLRHDPDVIRLEFIQHLFTKPEILALLKRECSGEINPGISRGAFLNIEIPLPSLPEQDRILAIVDDIERKKRRLNEQIRGLDGEIDKEIRGAVPSVISNYEDIKIRRAEFIGEVTVSDQE